ncbi:MULTISPECIES: glycosyltransferase family 1 protein [Paenibacillus]|uniref:Glycosyltransferase family 1 protein n=1 Tax=Paenibacillus odorifer TaxID=189426 RepID=A0ABX3HC74_9BACL|nr:glycosyltransferase family 1 protein [Paenibacillus odorifer]OMD46962.1 hypothetical protein BSK51_25810 [Paenibacillus odorifer]
MVKIVYFMTPLSNGGIEKMVISWIEHMNANEVHIDIVPQGIKNEEAKRHLESLGCNIYNMPLRQRNIIQKISFIRKLFKSNHYDIVHVHTSVAFDFLPLVIAKYFSIKHRIMHSHNTNTFNNSYIKKWTQNISKFFSRYYATHFFACSKDAGYNMFGEKKIKDKLIVVKNGIEVEKFKFNAYKRKQIRDEYGLSEKIVFGHIGRFNKQKNHNFLIETFYQITKLRENVILLLIGEGELVGNCKRQVEELGISDKVFFLGVRKNVNDYLQAMDIFMFPSLYEGLGVVLIEAQCSGLPCIVSKEIVDEAILTDKIEKIDLKLTALDWANIAVDRINSEEMRNNAWIDVMKNDYSIKSSSEWLEHFYLNLVK